jgi:Uncharacterized conserved protein
MKIAIDASLRTGGAEPFLLVWRVEGTATVDRPALAAAIKAACNVAAESANPAADAAVERYKAELVKLGRNPNRYRISSDALIRRCRRDGALPSIHPLVDLNNLLSVRTGWPIGCYDCGMVVGDVSYRLACPGEIMATLGKGELDITNLPVLADEKGAFGSTVSDSVRTAVVETTDRPVFVMYGYGRPDEGALAALVGEAVSTAGLRLVDGPRLII